jgi:hypothetical protein
LDRRLGGFQSRSERGGEEKNSQLPPGRIYCWKTIIGFNSAKVIYKYSIK